MDKVSQGMVDGCANYSGDPTVEAHCIACVETIDQHILQRFPHVRQSPRLLTFIGAAAVRHER